MFHYALTNPQYTVNNALTWGLCYDHFTYASEGPCEERCYHFVMAILELPPVFGQLVSLVELITAWFFCIEIDPPEHFIPPLIPGHHTRYSPVLGTRAHEIEAVRDCLRSHPILGALENAVHEPPPSNLIPADKADEAEAAAHRLFLEYIAKYQHLGVTEQNIVEWRDGSAVSSSEVSFFVPCSSIDVHLHTIVGRQKSIYYSQSCYGGHDLVYKAVLPSPPAS